MRNAVSAIWIVLACAAQAGAVIAPTAAEVALSQAGNWLAGRPYSLKFTVTGATGCEALKADISALPANFIWTSSATSGELAGTFTAAGTFKFSLTSTCTGSVSKGSYTVKVGGPLTMMSGPFLPPCVVGVGCGAYVAREGAPAYTAQVTSGALPEGCELVAGRIGESTKGVLLGCMAAKEGTYDFALTVTDGFGESLSRAYTLVVGPPGAFYTSSNVMTFALMAGGAARTQPVGVGTSDLSVAKFDVVSDAAWLKAEQTAPQTPASVNLTADPSTLAAGMHTATVTLTPQGGRPEAKVLVTAVVSEPTARLGLAPGDMEIEIPAGTEPQVYQFALQAWNEGTLGLDARVSTIASKSVNEWLSVDAAELRLEAGEAKPVLVRADATRLPPGTHQGWISVGMEGQGQMASVTVVVPKRELRPVLHLTGSTWSSGPIYYHLADTRFDDNLVNVINDEWSTVMDFTATVEGFRGYAWMEPAEGRSTAGKPVQMSIAINQAELGPGRYEGLLTVTAPGALNSPSYLKIRHVLGGDGAESGSATPVEAVSATPVVRGTEQAPRLQIINPGNSPVNFTVACPGGELQVDTPAGTVDARSSITVTARVNESKLTNSELIALWETRMWGLYNSYTTRQSKTVVLPPTLNFQGARGAAQSALEASGSCVAERLIVAPAAPANYFRRQTDWPGEIRAAVVDNCGNAVEGASVSAAFSSGEAAVALGLNAGGQYAAQWTPARAGEVSLVVRALKEGLAAGSSEVFGTVLEDDGAPVVSELLPAVASPGAVLVIKGRHLAAEGIAAEGRPLPRTLAGTTVLLGGVELPLFWVNAEEVRAQLPWELEPETAQALVVKAGERISTPKRLRITVASPSILLRDDGSAFALHEDGSAVTAEAPAKAGERLRTFLTGMGAVSVPVENGAASPEGALVVNAATATLGGAAAEVISAGLLSGDTGLYEMILRVPEGLTAGAQALVVMQGPVSSGGAQVPVAP